MYPATTQFDTRIRELVEEIAEIKATLDDLSERALGPATTASLDSRASRCSARSRRGRRR